MSCRCSRLRRRGQPLQREEEGSHEDCAYSGKKRAATRTVPTAGRRGQPRGLCLQREEEGSHKDCPYGGKRRAATRTAPTAGREEGRHEDCPYGDCSAGCKPAVPAAWNLRLLHVKYPSACRKGRWKPSTSASFQFSFSMVYIWSIPSIVSGRYVRIDEKRGRIWARLYVHLVSHAK